MCKPPGTSSGITAVASSSESLGKLGLSSASPRAAEGLALGDAGHERRSAMAAEPLARAPAASTDGRQLAPRPSRGPQPRLAVVDWLRGFAVVLMIQTHLYDAWVAPAFKGSAAYHWTRFWGGIPSRLFLFLVGVSLALRFEAQLAQGVKRRADFIVPAAKRGLEILLLAYLFRLQEYLLGHLQYSWVDLPRAWEDIVKVDILNCIGASMMVVPLLAAPVGGRPPWLLLGLGVAVFAGLGPIVGPHPWPWFVPRPLASYIGGPRPMAWFPLFPWAAWPVAGVFVGHLWVRHAREPRGATRTFLLSGMAGAALIGIVNAIRAIDPQVIRYPSELVQQMGPGSFFYRLGINLIVSTLAFAAVRLAGKRFSLMQQFGRTSLLVYWVHIELCYGLLAFRLHLYGRLTMVAATGALLVMVALMLALSLAKTRWWDPRRRQMRAARAVAGAG